MTTLEETVVRVKVRNTLTEHLLFVHLPCAFGRPKKKKDYSKGPLLRGFPLVLTTREPQKVRMLEEFNLQLAPCWLVIS